jgi:hypothetical protein
MLNGSYQKDKNETLIRNGIERDFQSLVNYFCLVLLQVWIFYLNFLSHVFDRRYTYPIECRTLSNAARESGVNRYATSLV